MSSSSAFNVTEMSDEQILAAVRGGATLLPGPSQADPKARVGKKRNHRGRGNPSMEKKDHEREKRNEPKRVKQPPTEIIAEMQQEIELMKDPDESELSEMLQEIELTKDPDESELSDKQSVQTDGCELEDTQRWLKETEETPSEATGQGRRAFRARVAGAACPPERSTQCREWGRQPASAEGPIPVLCSGRH